MSVISVVSLEANAVAVTLKNANTLMIRTAFMFPPLDPRPAVLIVSSFCNLVRTMFIACPAVDDLIHCRPTSIAKPCAPSTA